MIVCPHCGWENPREAAFCTNCGRGLAKARGSRVAPHDDAAESRGEANRRAKLAEAGGKTVRDHEMPLLRALAPSVTPPPVPPPLPVSDEPPPAAEALVHEFTTGELEAAAPVTEPPVPAAEPEPEPAPLPRLRAPGPQRDATATLVDFPMPTSFITDLGQSARQAPADEPGQTVASP